jgi:hypothetical protein
VECSRATLIDMTQVCRVTVSASCPFHAASVPRPRGNLMPDAACPAHATGVA